ncbi:MAG: NAD(P)/FAD-dependent oxidoreductase [Candidatus Paceibacterota bacterium]
MPKKEQQGDQDRHWDVIVVGGGPSGMMAAGRAGERGARVLLLEKNREPGQKLLLTGGGRCNIFQAEEDKEKLLSQYGEAKPFLHSPFSQHGMEDSWKFFEGLGLPIVVEARKRAFPDSQKASDVLKALKKYMSKNNVTVLTNSPVKGIKTNDGRVVKIETANEVFTADSYIIATGGTSHPETGSTGEGLKWLKSLGHTVHSPSPDLVPLVVKEEWVKRSSGATLSFMKITFGTDRAKKEGKFSETGKILFTHFGLSGPLILNASRSVKKLLSQGPVPAEIDMYPDTDTGSLRKRLINIFEKNKNKALKNVLSELMPESLCEAVLSHYPLELREKKIHSVSKEERNELADIMKAMPLTVTGIMGSDWAITSDGGVDLKEVDTRSMRSKLLPDLYLTGDVLHINRPSGGYSLQLCWTTGWVAGSSVLINN